MAGGKFCFNKKMYLPLKSKANDSVSTMLSLLFSSQMCIFAWAFSTTKSIFPQECLRIGLKPTINYKLLQQNSTRLPCISIQCKNSMCLLGITPHKTVRNCSVLKKQLFCYTAIRQTTCFEPNCTGPEITRHDCLCAEQMLLLHMVP